MSQLELVDLFEKISLLEGEAMSDLETAKVAKYFWQRQAVVRELRHRASDERPALFDLYDHKHPQVRLNVANSTYALNPDRAKSVMGEVAKSKLQPWAFHAGMSVYLLESGMSQLPNDPE
jgi:hypothetical protein